MRLDHLIVAARTLDEGSAWIEERLGVKPVPGGKHGLMGTHNRLLKLGERVYLEVIAVDPDAPKPSRPRWMSLDEPEMVERLEQGPALVHWVLRTEAIESALEGCPDREVEVLSLSRGEYRWRIGVRPDGRLPCGGSCPTLIQWEGDAHPAARLPESGCRIVELDTAGPALRARIACPPGLRTLE
jgi:hypothetical protein